MAASNKTDNELWIDVKNGNNKAFTLLFNRYWKKIYITAFSHLKNKELCEDIVHDIFLTLWKKRDALNINAFETYIIAAARYHVYKVSKSVRAKNIFFSTNPSIFVNDIDINDGEDKLVFDDMNASLNTCIEQLPNRCSEIFKLSRIEFLSNEEIANKLNISKRTVENQITYALHHIRIFLKEKSYLLSILFFFFVHHH